MTVEIEHDWQRFGAAVTVDGRPVVRLADLVKSRLSASHPLKVASDEVVELIARHDGLELFLLRPNNPAAALQLNGQWAAPLLAESWFGYDIRDVHESEFYQWWDWTDGAGYPFSEARGDPRRLSGALGMLAAAHYLWTQRAKSVADLDGPPAGSIAVLKADADRLFGVTPALVQAIQLIPPKKPGEEWTKEHRIELLRQHQSLTNPPSAFKVGRADVAIAEAWHVGESNVKQQRLQANKERAASDSSQPAIPAGFPKAA